MNNKTKLIIKVFFIIIIVLLLLMVGLFLIRAFSEKQVDDVNPGIECARDILEKSDVFAVIPLYQNVSIAENRSWCDWIIGMNKTLIMHGVYHSYDEFYGNISIDDLNIGMKAFKECFGYYPKIFEAPQLALSEKNEELVEKIGMKVRGNFYQMTHKVYHCGDSGELSNRVIDLF